MKEKAFANSTALFTFMMFDKLHLKLFEVSQI